ncbi:hypothetical protein V6N11_072846 [Hibiscus sabdariffa]|uniref:Secreted protein n=1 Tax=Hibiscus sabdariffa TaxID=183260 RepID=A0ABR2A6L3_9ROSI
MLARLGSSMTSLSGRGMLLLHSSLLGASLWLGVVVCLVSGLAVCGEGVGVVPCGHILSFSVVGCSLLPGSTLFQPSVINWPR